MTPNYRRELFAAIRKSASDLFPGSTTDTCSHMGTLYLEHDGLSINATPAFDDDWNVMQIDCFDHESEITQIQDVRPSFTGELDRDVEQWATHVRAFLYIRATAPDSLVSFQN